MDGPILRWSSCNKYIFNILNLKYSYEMITYMAEIKSSDQSITKELPCNYHILITQPRQCHITTIQTLNSYTSRPDVCRCPVVQTCITCQKNKPSTSMTYMVYESKLRSVVIVEQQNPQKGSIFRVTQTGSGTQPFMV